MEQLARRLMNLHVRGAAKTITAIFGTMNQLPSSVLNRASFRIGLWPCVSTESPEAAIGLMAVLGYLLERWQDVQVYRLFAQLEGEVDQYEWSSEKSQFGFDDWSLEPLDENIALRGELKAGASGGWHLILTIENDMLADETTSQTVIEHHATNWQELVYALPTLAERIINEIGAELIDESIGIYDATVGMDETALKTFLEQLFQWELELFLLLWGKALNEDDILDVYEPVEQAALALQNDFAAWTLAQAVARAMLPGFELTPLMREEVVAGVIEDLPSSHHPTVLLSGALHRAGDPEAAYEMLQTAIKTHPDVALIRLRLAILYSRGGRIPETLDVLQHSIEDEIVNRPIYHLYGNTLIAAQQYQIIVEDFVLVNPDDYDDLLMQREAVEAYEEALKLQPDYKFSIYRQASQLSEIDEARFWQRFQQLLLVDETGESVRDVIETMALLEDMNPAVKGLEALQAQYPDRMDITINLAAVLLADERSEEAEQVLRGALEKAKQETDRATIERMLLTAQDPEFEQHFGDLNGLIEAGGKPTDEDMEFLEDVLEQAPSFVQAYILLAKAYQLWKEDETALEVLLDGQKVHPDQPDLLDALAEALWKAGEGDVAFQYINKGLQNHPNHIPLLVRAGRYLFDNDQLADARVYLSRAEALDPNDPILAKARVYIANEIGNDPEKIARLKGQPTETE